MPYSQNHVLAPTLDLARTGQKYPGLSCYAKRIEHIFLELTLILAKNTSGYMHSEMTKHAKKPLACG